MLLRWLVAALHLVALGIGLGSVWARGRALRGAPATDALRRAFYADTLWGIAAIVWIATGAARAFGGLEKGTTYYVTNHVFWTKMALLGVILVLEVMPAATLVRWRMEMGRGGTPDTSRAGTLATISFAQAALVIGMVFAASAMARGFGH